jgi:hypothetical protein
VSTLPGTSFLPSGHDLLAGTMAGGRRSWPGDSEVEEV